jgi:hypothetical protein
MAVHSDDGGTSMTGDAIPVFRVLTIRRGLILKIDTGMDLTRLSPLKAAQTDGITVKRTYRGALRDVNKWLREQGMEPKWSRTYPQG